MNKKFLLVNFNKKQNRYLPMISLVDDVDKTKIEVKKQLIHSILNNPESLSAFRELEMHLVGETTDIFEVKNYEENNVVFTYEEVLNEIIDQLTKEYDKKDEN